MKQLFYTDTVVIGKIQNKSAMSSQFVLIIINVFKFLFFLFSSFYYRGLITNDDK